VIFILVGMALLAAYGIGHCLVIAIAGSSAAWTQRVLDWNATSTTGKLVKHVCGILVILGGLYMLWTALKEETIV
jgi:cytochrome c-type biogenesis protein